MAIPVFYSLASAKKQDKRVWRYIYTKHYEDTEPWPLDTGQDTEKLKYGVNVSLYRKTVIIKEKEWKYGKQTSKGFIILERSGGGGGGCHGWGGGGD